MIDNDDIIRRHLKKQLAIRYAKHPPNKSTISPRAMTTLLILMKIMCSLSKFIMILHLAFQRTLIDSQRIVNDSLPRMGIVVLEIE